jgi:hypothetical protein
VQSNYHEINLTLVAQIQRKIYNYGLMIQREQAFHSNQPIIQTLLEKTHDSITRGVTDISPILAHEIAIDMINHSDNYTFVKSDYFTTLATIGATYLGWDEKELSRCFKEGISSNKPDRFEYYAYSKWFDVFNIPTIAHAPWALRTKDEILRWWETNKKRCSPIEQARENLMYAHNIQTSDPNNPSIKRYVAESTDILMNFHLTYPNDISFKHPRIDDDELYCNDRLYIYLHDTVYLLKTLVNRETFHDVIQHFTHILEDPRIAFIPQQLLTNILGVLQEATDQTYMADIAQRIAESCFASGRYSQADLNEIIIEILPILVNHPAYFQQVESYAYFIAQQRSHKSENVIRGILQSALRLNPNAQTPYILITRDITSKRLQQIPLSNTLEQEWVFRMWILAYCSYLKDTQFSHPVMESEEVLCGIEMGMYDFALDEIPTMVTNLKNRSQYPFAEKIRTALLHRLMHYATNPDRAIPLDHAQQILFHYPEYAIELINLIPKPKKKTFLM